MRVLLLHAATLALAASTPAIAKVDSGFILVGSLSRLEDNFEVVDKQDKFAGGIPPSEIALETEITRDGFGQFSSASSSVLVSAPTTSSGNVKFLQIASRSELGPYAPVSYVDFRYYFVVPQQSNIKVSYDVSLTGDGVIYDPYAIQASILDQSTYADYGDPNGVTGRGVIRATIPAGEYYLFLQNQYRFQTERGGSLTGSANFTYNITPTAPVPEPSVWAFLIVGFVAVGLGLRRRRATYQLGFAQSLLT